MIGYYDDNRHNHIICTRGQGCTIFKLNFKYLYCYIYYIKEKYFILNNLWN